MGARALLPAAATWVATLALAAPAVADDTPPLVVYYAPTGSGASATTARTALEGAARRGRTALIDISPPAPVPPTASVELQRGIERYHGLDYAGALGHLDRALDEAVATGAAGLTTSEVSDLLIYRALVFTAQGDSTRAWDEFVRAAVVDPTRKLDPARYSPRVVETFQRAVSSVTAASTSSVTIEAPAECKAWFDARVVGVREPITAARGEHFLRVQCDDHLPYGARVLVSEAGQTLRPGLRQPKAPSRADVVNLAARRGATTVLFAVVAAPTLTMAVIDTSTGKTRERVVSPLDDPDLGGAADALIGRVVSPPTRIVKVPVKPAAKRWYERPWVWGVAGAVVATAVLVPLLADSSPTDSFDVEVPLP